ncbi:MAG: chemotaxis protein CheW [Eubacterium sp.]
MKEIIVFFLSDKEYGIEISGMQSLENYQEIEHESDLPEGMSGLVKIRDEIYPVYDMKRKLCLPAKEVTEDTKILLLRTKAGKIAIVVDRVGKVFRAQDADVKDFPCVARMPDTDYIDFVAKRGNELIVVINPDSLLDEEQFAAVEHRESHAEETSDDSNTN